MIIIQIEMEFNPFDQIDINSCLHKEYSPYKIINGVLFYPRRYYELYLEKLFNDHQIDIERTGTVPLDEEGFLINSNQEKTPINLDAIEYEQRKVFHVDQWYPEFDNTNITFGCFIIDLKEKERNLLASRKIDDEGLFSLKAKIRNVMIANKEIKWWFVRLNSVSPKDKNKSGKQHKYNSPHRILKRLIESDRTYYFIANDDEAKIVLRPWYDFPEKMEFRCFVHKKKLRAISQYSCYTYYPEFQDKLVQEGIRSRIIKFYSSIKEYIPYIDCVMDVVIWDETPLSSFKNQNIYVIEFNEFGAETPCGSGLYNWIIDYDQLYNAKHPTIRFVETESEVDKLARKIDDNILNE